jgi:catechol 2,3-dioxygenase-like lactoylglutathione lyase family enzyme
LGSAAKITRKNDDNKPARRAMVWLHPIPIVSRSHPGLGNQGVARGEVSMKRVTGIGGVFFKADDPEKLYQWYEKHLGIRRQYGVVVFDWRDAEDPGKEGQTAWAIFPRTSKKFDPSTAGHMMNYRVDDMDALLAALKEEGVTIDPHREDGEYGRFAWIMDPDGNRIELWEPAKEPEPPGETSTAAE